MKILKYLFFLLVMLAFNSCKKEAESIFTTFKDIEVTFHNKSEYSITEDAVLNDGDSVHIHYTITSANEDMYRVVVDTTIGTGNYGERIINLKENERRSYSGVIKHKMMRDGKVTFRVYAMNIFNEYMGDGYTNITVDGRPSYTHLPNRKVYASRVNFAGGVAMDDNIDRRSFFSLRRAEAFDYQNGKTNSKDIDFGIHLLRDTRPAHLNRASFNLYSINTPTNPLPVYDISDWEKRNTMFSAPIKSAGTIFSQQLVSSSAIEARAKAVNINLLQTNITEWDAALGPGNLVYFLTPEGKYGAMLVNQTTSDNEGPYISVSVKYQN